MDIGIIQSHGLGDIVIALPIAKWLTDRGHQVHWPIPISFMPSFSAAAPYINFIPMDRPVSPLYTDILFDDPERLLRDLGCQRIVPLYSFLANDSGPVAGAVIDPALGRRVRFDHYKYLVSGVPFDEKWRLADAISRDRGREQALFSQVVSASAYSVCQLRGSRDYAVTLNLDLAPGHQMIEISPVTDNIFDWLSVIEGAAHLYMIDSCFANVVEQLNIDVPKTFIHRSKPQFTPTLRSDWRYLHPS